MKNVTLKGVCTAAISYMLGACSLGEAPTDRSVSSTPLTAPMDEMKNNNPWKLYYGNLRSQEQKQKLVLQVPEGPENGIKDSLNNPCRVESQVANFG